jgi:hypothetical protein
MGMGEITRPREIRKIANVARPGARRGAGGDRALSRTCHGATADTSRVDLSRLGARRQLSRPGAVRSTARPASARLARARRVTVGWSWTRLGRGVAGVAVFITEGGRLATLMMMTSDDDGL